MLGMIGKSRIIDIADMRIGLQGFGQGTRVGELAGDAHFHGADAAQEKPGTLGIKAAAEKKIADNKRLIDEANEKLAAHEDEMLELPREIDRVNRELMLNTMALCYEKLSANTDEIEQISDWIHKIRIELKKQLITKQEKEYYNSELYSFMHDIFGQDVMELFDMRYEPTLRSRGNDPA